MIGGPALGDDFFNRTKEHNQILKMLKKDSVLLIAPRRYGKTSLMKKIEQTLIQKNHACLHLDVMHIYSPIEFVKLLVDNFFSRLDDSKRRKFLNLLKGTMKKIEKISVNMDEGITVKFRDVLREEITEDTWEKKGSGILEVISKTSDTTSYIILDELCECISNIAKNSKQEAIKFLQWLRVRRIEVSENTKFLISGSTSIDWIVSDLDPIKGCSLINDLDRFYLEGFSLSDALEFVTKISAEYGITYDNSLGEKILDCLGEPYIPYFISVFMSIIQQKSNGKVSRELIEKIYRNDFLSVRGKPYFQYYRQRLNNYSPSFAKAANKILDKASMVDDDFPIDLAFSKMKLG